MVTCVLLYPWRGVIFVVWRCYVWRDRRLHPRLLREKRGITVLFFVNLGTLDGGGWSTPRLCRLYPGKHPVPIVQEAGWASEPVSIGAENLAPTGIRSPGPSSLRKSLYRLRYPGFGRRMEYAESTTVACVLYHQTNF